MSLKSYQKYILKVIKEHYTYNKNLKKFARYMDNKEFLNKINSRPRRKH